MNRTIRLWDLPTRLVHWLLVAGVVGAIITAKLGGNLMVWHGRIGLALAGLVVFRLVWGFVGSTYARFGQFVRGPSGITAYLRGQWQGVGHNPIGAISVLVLLALLAVQTVTGLFANDDIAFYGPLYALISKDTSDALTGWHHRFELLIYLIIGLHVAAIVFYAVVKKQRLVPPMITGRKPVSNDSAQDARGGGLIAFILALAIALGAVWAASGALNPPPPAPPASVAPAW